MLSVAICIPAYNEEKNIGKLLTALLAQKTQTITISEIIVVSSGSTDRTNTIVERFCQKDSRIQLILFLQHFSTAVIMPRLKKSCLVAGHSHRKVSF